MLTHFKKIKTHLVIKITVDLEILKSNFNLQRKTANLI
jgi:hypothetical protein